MSKATHASIILVRFDDLIQGGDVQSNGEHLFMGVGADVRAAATENNSESAFKFAILGLHSDESSARRAVSNRMETLPWIDGAKETWWGILAPFRHFGECNLIDSATPSGIFFETANAPDPSIPFVVMTTAGWQLDPNLEMQKVRDFSAGVAAVRISMTGVPGLHSQQTFSFPGGLVYDGITVTFWKDFDSMKAFAYGPGIHRSKMKSHREGIYDARTSFTRFVVLESGGTWHGSDPMAWPREA